MSPTAFEVGKYRFFFFSREEIRRHIHVICPNGEAKFWLEPVISLDFYSGLSRIQSVTIYIGWTLMWIYR